MTECRPVAKDGPVAKYRAMMSKDLFRAE